MIERLDTMIALMRALLKVFVLFVQCQGVRVPGEIAALTETPAKKGER